MESPNQFSVRLGELARVRAYGAWIGVDVHALDLDGAPLLAKVAVDYPLGLRGRAAGLFLPDAERVRPLTRPFRGAP